MSLHRQLLSTRNELRVDGIGNGSDAAEDELRLAEFGRGQESADAECLGARDDNANS